MFACFSYTRTHRYCFLRMLNSWHNSQVSTANHPMLTPQRLTITANLQQFSAISIIGHLVRFPAAARRRDLVMIGHPGNQSLIPRSVSNNTQSKMWTSQGRQVDRQRELDGWTPGVSDDRPPPQYIRSQVREWQWLTSPSH